VQYTPVQPAAVENEVDSAYDHGRFRQPVRYRRYQLDLAMREPSLA